MQNIFSNLDYRTCQVNGLRGEIKHPKDAEESKWTLNI